MTWTREEPPVGGVTHPVESEGRYQGEEHY